MAGGSAGATTRSSRCTQEQDDYTQQHASLATTFPHGRFTRDADGTAILTSRTDPSAQVFEVAPRRLVGLLYVGGPSRYLHALQGLVVRRMGAELVVVVRSLAPRPTGKPAPWA